MARERRRIYLPERYPFWLKAPLILFGLYLLGVILSYGRFILMPLAFAALFALLLNPLIKLFESRKIGRAASIILALLLLAAVFAGITTLIAIQFMQFADRLPELAEKLKSATEEGYLFIEQITGISREQQTEYANIGIENMFEASGEYLRTFMSATRDTLLFFGLLPVFIFFMLYYKEMYKTFLNKAFAQSRNSDIDNVILRVQMVAQHYLAGLFTIMLIMGVLNTIGLYIVGLEFALFFGALAAALAVIPFIGAILGSLPPILFAFIVGDSLLLPVLVLAVFTTVQLIESSILTPNIIGSRVSINPFVAIVVLFIGGQIWGIGGMILFVPLIGVLRIGFTQIDELQPYAYLLGNVIDYKKAWRNDKM